MLFNIKKTMHDIVFYARLTKPDLKARVDTYTRLILPFSSIMRTFCKFAFQERRVACSECERELPATVPNPVI